jgi:adenylate cyclase
VYARSDGVDFSGVELHATAFANLLTGTALHPPGPLISLAILVGVGILLGGSSYWTRTRKRYMPGSVAARLEAATVGVLLAGAYSAATYILFARYYLIVPWVIPVTVQLPAALILGLLVRPTVREERVQAVCLAADASGSTAVGQRLAHDAYAVLITEYNRVLGRCVTSRGGLALAPHGDGFVSLWVLGAGVRDDGEQSVRVAACQAALEMVTAADRFNQAHAESERLPLKLGLTLGAVTIRSDADRGAFEAVGDAVNVAARLQQVNRELGTWVLASAQLVEDLSGHFNLQRIDVPLTLKGVRNAPDVFEVTGLRAFTGIVT